MFASLGLAFGLSGFFSAKLTAFFMAAIPVGAIAFALFQVVKRVSAQVDGLKNPVIKQAIVAGIAFALTAGFAAAGVTIECVPGANCLEQVTQDKLELVLRSLLSAATAFVLHAVKQGRK